MYGKLLCYHIHTNYTIIQYDIYIDLKNIVIKHNQTLYNTIIIY